VSIGVLSLVTASLYIPEIKEATGIEVMEFLASEIGSEKAVVDVWYPVSLLLGIASLVVSCFRIRESLVSISFFTIALTAIIQLPPFCLWLFFFFCENNIFTRGIYDPVTWYYFDSVSNLCIQLLKHSKKVRQE
jgi:hypothetical protein